MATEENKALIRRLNQEVWNQGTLALIADMLGLLQQLGAIPVPGQPGS